MLYVILSTVGPYYPTGFEPVSLYCDLLNVRAWPGGTGDKKLGGNYAATIKHSKNASDAGYQQVLWLLDDQVTEVGTMNFFVHWTSPEGVDELITAPLDGTILPGVTRNSLLALAKEWGINVSERKFTMTELAQAVKDGRCYEAFGVGTAAVVSPVGKI
jgi:branched-chain amino acid aminotransferase